MMAKRKSRRPAVTYEHVQANLALLQQVATNTYPHGLDLGPLAHPITMRWVSVATNHGKLMLRLTALGRQALEDNP